MQSSVLLLEFSPVSIRKPSIRMIATAVDISKSVWHSLSLRLLIEMVHRSIFRQNLASWLEANHCSWNMTCIYQWHTPLFRQVSAGAPPLLILFNLIVSDCPTTDLDMTSYAKDFTELASAPIIVEAEETANLGLIDLVGWTDRK